MNGLSMSAALQNRVKSTNSEKLTGTQKQVSLDTGQEDLSKNKSFGQKIKTFFSKIKTTVANFFKKSEPSSSTAMNTVGGQSFASVQSNVVGRPSEAKGIISQTNMREKLEQTKAFISKSAHIGIDDSSSESLHETQDALRHVLGECKLLKGHDFGVHTEKTHEMLTRLEEKTQSKLNASTHLISEQSSISESSKLTCDTLRSKQDSSEGLSKDDVLTFVREHKQELKSASGSTLKELSKLIQQTLESSTKTDDSNMSDELAISNQLTSLESDIEYVTNLKEALPTVSIGLISTKESLQNLKSEIETANAKLTVLEHTFSHVSDAKNETDYGAALTTTCTELKQVLTALDSVKDMPGFPKDRFLNSVKTKMKIMVEDQINHTKTNLQSDDYDKDAGNPSVSKSASFNASKSRMLANVTQNESVSQLFPESDRLQQRSSALENYETHLLKLSKSDLADEVSKPKTGELEAELPEMKELHAVLHDFTQFKGFDIVSSEQKKGMVDIYTVADLKHPDKKEGKALLLKGLNTIHAYHTDPKFHSEKTDMANIATKINESLNDITRIDPQPSYSQKTLKAIMESSLSSSEKLEARQVGNKTVDDLTFDISKGLEDMGRLPKGIASAQRDLDFTTRELTNLYNQSVKDSSHKLNAADFQFNDETVAVLQSKIGGKGLEGILIRAALSQNTLQKMEADVPSSGSAATTPFVPKNNIQTIYTTLVRGRLDRYKSDLEKLKDMPSNESSGQTVTSESTSLLETKNKDIADLEQVKLELGGLQHCTDLKEFKKLNSAMRTMQATFVADKSDLNNLLMMQSDKQQFALEVLNLKQENKENRTVLGSTDKTINKVLRAKTQATSKNESVQDTMSANKRAIEINYQLDKRPGLKQVLGHAIESKSFEIREQYPSMDVATLKQTVKDSLHFTKGGSVTLLQSFTKEVTNEKKQALFNEAIDVLVDQSFETDTSVDHLAIATDFDQDPKTEGNHKTFEKIVSYFERKTSGVGTLEKFQVDILNKLVEKGKSENITNLTGEALENKQQAIIQDTISEMLGDEYYSKFSTDTGSKEAVSKKAIYKDMITYLTKQGAMGHTEKWVARLHLNKQGIERASTLGVQNKGEQLKSMRTQLEILEKDTGTTNRKQTTIQGSDIMQFAGVAERALFSVSLTIDVAKSLQLEHEVKKDANGSILIRFEKERSSTTRLDIAGPGAIVTGGVEHGSSAIAGRTFRFDSVDDAARALVDFYSGDSRTLLGLADGMITESASKSSLALEASLNLKLGGTGLQLDGNAGGSIKESVIKDGFTQTVRQQTMVTFGGGLTLTDGTGQVFTDVEMRLYGQVTMNITNEISTPTYNPTILSGHRVIFEQEIIDSKDSDAASQIKQQLCNVLGKESPIKDLESVVDTQGLDAFAATLEPGDSYEIIQTLNSDAVKLLTPETATSITGDLKNYTVSLKKVSKDMLNQVTTSYGSTYSKSSDLERTQTHVLVLNTALPKGS